MNDLVRRKDTIEGLIFKSGINENGLLYVPYRDVIKCLENVPSAEPQWIPCSERLPETSDEVFTTYIVNGNHKKRFVETATYYNGDEGYWSSPWDEYRIFGTRVEVIAWMPLPSPYRGEQDGQD